MKKLRCQKGIADGMGVVIVGSLIFFGAVGHEIGLTSKNGRWAKHDIDHMRQFTNYNSSSRIIFGGKNYKPDQDVLDLRFPKP